MQEKRITRNSKKEVTKKSEKETFVDCIILSKSTDLINTFVTDPEHFFQIKEQVEKSIGRELYRHELKLLIIAAENNNSNYIENVCKKQTFGLPESQVVINKMKKIGMGVANGDIEDIYNETRERSLAKTKNCNGDYFIEKNKEIFILIGYEKELTVEEHVKISHFTKKFDTFYSDNNIAFTEKQKVQIIDIIEYIKRQDTKRDMNNVRTNVSDSYKKSENIDEFVTRIFNYTENKKITKNDIKETKLIEKEKSERMMEGNYENEELENSQKMMKENEELESYERIPEKNIYHSEEEISEKKSYSKHNKFFDENQEGKSKKKVKLEKNKYNRMIEKKSEEIFEENISEKEKSQERDYSHKEESLLCDNQDPAIESNFLLQKNKELEKPIFMEENYENEFLLNNYYEQKHNKNFFIENNLELENSEKMEEEDLYSENYINIDEKKITKSQSKIE